VHRDFKMSSKNNNKQTTTVSLGGQGAQPTTSVRAVDHNGERFPAAPMETAYLPPSVAPVLQPEHLFKQYQPVMFESLGNVLTSFVEETGLISMDQAILISEWMLHTVEFTFLQLSTKFSDIAISVLERVIFELLLKGMTQRGDMYFLPLFAKKSILCPPKPWRNEIYEINASVESAAKHSRALGCKAPASHLPVVSIATADGDVASYRDVTPLGSHKLMVDLEQVTIAPALDRVIAPKSFGDCSHEVKRRIMSFKTPVSVSVLADFLGFTKRSVREHVLVYSITVYDRNSGSEHNVNIFNGAKMSGLFITIWGQAQISTSGSHHKKFCNWPMHPTQLWVGNLLNLRPRLWLGLIENGSIVCASEAPTNPGGRPTITIATQRISQAFDMGPAQMEKGSPLPIMPPSRLVGTAIVAPIGKRSSLPPSSDSPAKKRHIQQHANPPLIVAEDVVTKSWGEALSSLLISIIAASALGYSMHRLSIWSVESVSPSFASNEFMVLYLAFHWITVVLTMVAFGYFLYDSMMKPYRVKRQVPTELWLRTRILNAFERDSEEYIYLEQLFNRNPFTETSNSSLKHDVIVSEVKVTQEAAQPQRNIAPLNLKRCYLSLVFRDVLGNETVLGGATNVTGVGIVSAAHVHREAVAGVNMTNSSSSYYFRDADGQKHLPQTKWIDYTRDVWVCKAPSQLDSVPELPSGFDVTNLDVCAVNSKLTDTTIGKWRKVDGSKFFYHKLHLVEGDSGVGICVRAKENKTYYLGFHGGARGLSESTRIENYGILISSWMGAMRSTSGDVALDEKSPLFADEYYNAKEKSLDDANVQSLNDELSQLSTLDLADLVYPPDVTQEAVASQAVGYVNQMIGRIKHMVLRDKDGPKNLFVKSSDGKEVFNYGVCTLYRDSTNKLFVKLPNGHIEFMRCVPFGPVWNELVLNKPEKWLAVKHCYSRQKLNAKGQLEYEIHEISHTPIPEWGVDVDSDTESVTQEAARFLQTERLAELRKEVKPRQPTPPPSAPEFLTQEQLVQAFQKMMDERSAAAKLKREEEAAKKKASTPTPAQPKPKKEKAKKQQSTSVVKQEAKQTPAQKAESSKVSVFDSMLLN